MKTEKEFLADYSDKKTKDLRLSVMTLESQSISFNTDDCRKVAQKIDEIILGITPQIGQAIKQIKQAIDSLTKEEEKLPVQMANSDYYQGA